ncbi:hypothetical protein HBN50_16675 [Halobacteriovorax sp. GB3]|uniref:hypothetical protein n=1 Tax=Halobacteriovorax sp. GB3 TaxID=2719615 RepID=UPI00235E403F|nr:hypothetical protein [Halobacteriovorax sp. GB3]MDD0854746.1 hypothetical protein [Halobacteriovorax sp. GB3]
MKKLLVVSFLFSLLNVQTYAFENLSVFLDYFERSFTSKHWLNDYYSNVSPIENNKNEIEKKDDVNVVVDSVAQVMAATKKKAAPSDNLTDLLSFIEKIDKKNNGIQLQSNSAIELTLSSANIGINRGKRVNQFSVTNITNGQISYSEEQKALLNFDSNNGKGTIRFHVDEAKYIPTSFEISLEFGLKVVDVPIFERETYLRFLDKYAPDAFGGALLIDLYDQIESTEINAPYAKKIYLDSRYRKTTQDGDYRYVLFVGVDQGNVLVQYMTMDGLYGEKIVNIQNDEVFYDYPIIKQTKTKHFNLYEESVLSKKLQELNLGTNKVVQLGTSNIAKEIGINRYSLNPMTEVVGMRNMIEFKSNRKSIVASYQDEANLVIPSREYVSYLLDLFEIGDLETNCVVDINPAKEIERINFEALDHKGKMPADLYYFDEDGMFDIEPSELTKKAYFIGSGPGVVYLELEYKDKTKDYVKTFCSNGSYLIEHL